MSPEQGKGERLDARSDLYSVGVLLYQLLTGHLPFEAETPVGLVLKHVTEEPKPPRALKASVDPELEAVCLTAMKKRPDDRYPNARAMRTALRAALDVVPSVDSLEAPGRLSLASAETEDALPLDAVRSAMVESGRMEAPPPRTSSDGAVPASVHAPALETPRAGRRVWLGALALAVVGGAVALGSYALSAKESVPREAARDLRDLHSSEPPRAAPAPLPSPSAMPVATASESAPGPPLATHEPPEPPPPVEPVRHFLPPKAPDHHPTAPSFTAAATDTATAEVAAPPPPATTDPPPITAPLPPLSVASAPTAAPPPPAPPPAPAFDPSRATVSIGGVSAIGATDGAVRRGLGGRLSTFGACYRNALARSQTKVEGGAVLHLIADDDGRVISAQARGLPMPEVLRCIEQAAVGFSIAGADTGEPSADISLVFRVAP